MSGNQEKKNIILVVDDDPMQRVLMREALSNLEFAVHEAEDGLQGVAKFNDLLPDLVILDVEMPNLNGFDACKEIRATPQGKYAAILMATGLEDDRSIDRAYEVGATDFIVKPLNWTIIRHRIKYLLRSNGLLQKLDLSQSKNQAILNAIPDTIIGLDCKGNCLEFHSGVDDSPLFPEHLQGKNIIEYLPKNAATMFLRNLQMVFTNDLPQSFEYCVDKNGKLNYFEARLVKNGDSQAMAIIRNVTEKKESADKIWKLAYYDKLTGLPNREKFKDRLQQMIEYAERYEKLVGVVYIDLDRFKNVNDAFGHTVGDKLLKLVVSRLQLCFRKSDCFARNVESVESEIARLGGDEFVVLLSDLDSVQGVNKVADRIIQVLSEPFILDDSEIFVTPSIGISIFPNDGDSVEMLLKNADSAMYCSKMHGRNTYHIYSDEMSADNKKKLQLETELHKAVEKKDFSLYYQPQINLVTGKLEGLEALIRWHHDELGPIGPDIFIPIAEELSLIDEIGRWVMTTACRQLKKWQDNNLEIPAVGVNISGKQFKNAKLADQVQNILEDTGLESSSLDIEITEGAIMHDPNMTISMLTKLSSLGVSISVDDFGTGYSSLSYLQKFPLNKLKIDRSFIMNITESERDVNIVKVILSLANVLHLKVIAEGAETSEQIEILRQLNCSTVQGYYFSKPLAADLLEEFVKSYKVA